MSTPSGHRGISRRTLLAGAGATAVGAATGVALGASPASAAGFWGYGSIVQAVDDGSLLYELTNLPNLGRVYAANAWTGPATGSPRHRIAVVDAVAGRVTGEIDLGEGSAFGLAANPDTDIVYAGDQVFTKRVYAIDGRTNRVVRSAEVGGDPRGLAVNPVTDKLYVTLTNQGKLVVLDGTTLAVEATLDFGLIEPAKVAVNPVTNTVYVSNANRRGADSSVTVIDGATNTVTATIGVDRYALGIAVNPLADKVYVSNYTSETLTVIDGATNGIVGKAYVGGSPTGVEVDPIAKKVYVTNFEQKGAVTVIDDVTHQVRRLRVRPAVLGLTVDSRAGRVYAASQTEGSVFLLDES